MSVPRHGVAWQSWASLSGPEQPVPLLRGGGLIQARLRICVPLPHVTEQSDHTDQGVQLPSTVKQKRIYYITIKSLH